MGPTIGKRPQDRRNPLPGSASQCRAPGPSRERRTPRPEVPMSAEPLSPESTAFRSALDVIRAVEPRIADAIGQEVADQREMLKLVASENYASPATLLAMGNWFSDKYAEGTVGRRFYAGCRNV